MAENDVTIAIGAPAATAVALDLPSTAKGATKSGLT
ncbi:hypothetical protein A2U01_0118685, partial [Trifolium medium]|nr:hypothetical protein [Trifolium medium]